MAEFPLSFDYVGFSLSSPNREQYLRELADSTTNVSAAAPEVGTILNGKKNFSSFVNVNENGLFEVKLPNQPTRAFSTSKNALEFFDNNYPLITVEQSQSQLKSKIESLRSKANKLQTLLDTNRGKLSKEEIIRYEKSLKEANSKLSSWQGEYNRLACQRDKILKEQKLTPIARQSLKNARLAEANAKFQGTSPFQLEQNLGLSNTRPPLSGTERSAYENFWKEELNKLDKAKPKAVTAANVYPSADGKEYGNMLRNSPVDKAERLSAKPFTEALAQTEPKVKTSFFKRFSKGLKGKKTLAGIVATAITATVGYNVYNAHQGSKIDLLLARKSDLKSKTIAA